MRSLKYVLPLLLLTASGFWIWSKLRIPCLEFPTANVQAAAPRRPDWAFFTPRSETLADDPPFAAMGIQGRWDYSHLVCTGSAEQPTRTGRTEYLGGADRDQLVTQVVLESCFKGVKPYHAIRVLGDSVFAPKNIRGGFIYSGPSTGFVARGRNLLFLRKTDRPDVWRVTIPVYEACIQLADLPPAYTLSGSDDAIRQALVAEMEAMIERGEARPVLGAINLATADPGQIAPDYLRHLLEILGTAQAMAEFANLLEIAPPAARPEIAMTMLREGDQRGVPDSLALLQDAGARSWQRVNAAQALAFATSPRARSALERISREAENQQLPQAAKQSLSRMHPPPNR